MSQVNVTINGRQFRMACEDGEEARLSRLAEELDASIATLRTRFGEIGDTRLTVMAAIMVADELADVRRRLKAAESELAALRDARALMAERANEREASVATALDEAAASIERLTAELTGLSKPNG